MATARMWQQNGSGRDVPFEPWILGFNVSGWPFTKDPDIRELLQFLAQTDPAFRYADLSSILNVRGTEPLMRPNALVVVAAEWMKILFVCDGNICRSPMAEALLRSILADRRIDWIDVTSAGLVASPFGVAHAQLRRVLGPSFSFVENRRSQPMNEKLVEEADLILGMEKRHTLQIQERFPGSKGKVGLVTSFAGRDVEVKDFPDSGYGDVVSWLRHCHSVMLPSVETIVDRLVRENKRGNEKVSAEKG